MYSKKVLSFLKKNNIELNDFVNVVTKLENFTGLLVNRPDYMKQDMIILKLDNGYNIGINLKNISKIKLIKKNVNVKEKKIKEPVLKKPFISILHTGGTIASKVDYRTGGVVSRFNPKELLESFPKLKKYGNIRSVFVKNMFSEDMRFSHFSELATFVKNEIVLGSKGVIITHGTDTMGYSSAALSFMLENLPIPVIFVGAQRSSDRGSSDAEMNLVCAINFIKNSKFRGVAVCMHEGSSDDNCIIIKGVNARKMHTSKRGAFKSINDKIIARVEFQGESITFFNEYQKTTNTLGKFRLRKEMEEKVGMIKAYPNLMSEQLRFFREKKYKGLIIEGTGLGHLGINKVDDLSKENLSIRKELQKLINSGCVVVMCSQAINGRVNMNVYSTGRDLLELGVISGDSMISETAFVKLSWLLKNEKNNVKKLMTQNLRGEITKRLLE